MNIYDKSGIISAGEPPPTADPLTQEEMNAIEPDKLELLGRALASRRDKWVAARQASGVEKRWSEDMDQYLGRDAATKQQASLAETIESGGYLRPADAKIQRSTVFVNITRPKTNAAESRLANMLFPVDDKCWGIRPTPNPHLMQLALEEARAETPQAPAAGMPDMQMAQMPAELPAMPVGGQQPAMDLAMPEMAQAPGAGMPMQLPPPPPDSARAKIEEAQRRAKAMEQEIHDALVEFDYNAEGRKMLHDCAVLGTGILKGPLVVNRVAKAWRPVGLDGTTHVLEVVQEARPASERVDPWNVYPDPACGEDIHAGQGIFEKKIFTAKQLRELASQPGYMPDQIAKVLAKGPQISTTANEHDRRLKEKMGATDQHFEVWEYWGEFAPEDLRECGVDMPDETVEVISGCVILVNDIVIKGFLNPLETGDLPYDFMVWEREEGSPWGYGIPYLMRPAQKVVNAAWRQMMDNAGLSVGPNVVVKPNIVQPADGNWQITGRKVWNCLDDSVDVRTAFHIFDLPNRSAEFQQIIELAMAFADEETSVPKLVQGEQGAAPETVGGMTILMNSANVVLTRMVKQFDDRITKPHIRRYYDWFMAYSPKGEIKGDFQVEARGSSALLVRDMQHQALLQFGQFQGSPMIAPMVNWDKWLREVLKAQHIDAADIIKSDAEIAQILNAPPSKSPDQVKAEAQVQVAQIRAQAALDAANAREQGENAFAATQAQMARDNHIAKLRELELERELAILKYAHEQKLTLEQVKADLAKTQVIEETKRQLGAAQLQLKAIEGDKNRAASRQRSSNKEL